MLEYLVVYHLAAGFAKREQGSRLIIQMKIVVFAKGKFMFTLFLQG